MRVGEFILMADEDDGRWIVIMRVVGDYCIASGPENIIVHIDQLEVYSGLVGRPSYPRLWRMKKPLI